MNPNARIIREVFIKALIDSVPDQQSVKEKINDPGFFQTNRMEVLFEELGIESLGRLWFLTILEEQLAIKIADPEAFFAAHANHTMDQVIDLLPETIKSNQP